MSAILVEQSALGRLSRTVLQHALVLTSIGIPLLSLLVIANAITVGFIDSMLVSLCVAQLAFPLLWLFSNRMPLPLVAILFLTLLGLAAVFVLVRGGLTTSSGAIPVMMIVLSGLFFGRVGSVVSLLSMLALLALSGVAVVNGWMPAINPALWDPHLARNWVRAAVALGVFGGGVAIAVIYVFECMQRENEELQEALAREESERRAKQEAEAERETVRQALAESQRLESLGRLAGGIAHDFNNVLTVIVGSADLAVQECGSDERVRYYLTEIQRASQHAAALTQQLALLGRRDIGLAQVIDLVEYFGRTADTLKRVIPDDITLDIDLSRARGARIRMEPLSLERILLSLVTSARDAIVGAGHIRIDVAIKRASKPGTADQVLLTVADSGSSFDDDTRSSILEPRFTAKRVGRGSGLGLTLVQSLVLDAGGSVNVESLPGEETRVTLSLPRASDDIPAIMAALADYGAEAADVGRGYTIFIVDDQLPVLATIMACLESVGFAVLTSQHGDDALQRVRDGKTKFDLLCLDGVIPGASSSQILAAMRIHHPHLPVVLCSGYTDEELLLRGVPIDEMACVRKPFHPAELVKVILEKLGLPASDSRSRPGPVAAG